MGYQYPARLQSARDIIIAEKVNKHYGAYHALRDVSITVKQGEVVVIIGPSGSGKSTFIRTINHLEQHQGGTITVDGTLLNNDVKNIDQIRREVGMVFQQFNLFPHLTVLQNITLAPIRVRKWDKKKAE
ncbi:ATP-binding cassette domain-containing protein, partial [Deinococcus roseus]|uniref:ATP-binding cassette domain-containing protein n=1 Tax=Deinococcus roseus TaxID=392414 RepID=UPI001E626844